MGGKKTTTTTEVPRNDSIKQQTKYNMSHTRVGIDTRHCSFNYSSVSSHDYFFCFPHYFFMQFQHQLLVCVMLAMASSSSSRLFQTHTSVHPREHIFTEVLVRVGWGWSFNRWLIIFLNFSPAIQKNWLCFLCHGIQHATPSLPSLIPTHPPQWEQTRILSFKNVLSNTYGLLWTL